MRWQVLVATVSTPDQSQLGPEWLEAGELDQGREHDLGRVLQGQLGLRVPSRQRTVEFYADLQPDSPGYRALFGSGPTNTDSVQKVDGSETRFWLALHAKDSLDKTFFAAERAEFARLSRRPPEPHPGLRQPGTPIGIRLTTSTGSFFIDT